MVKTAILTRPRGPYTGDEGLSQRLEAEGFSVMHLTSLAVEARQLRAEDESAIRASIQTPEWWIAFLSPTAVYVFRDHCVRLGVEPHRSGVRLAAQGPGTSEAVRKVFGREVDLESPIALAEVFAEQLALRLGGAGCVLIPQSADGRDIFGPLVQQSGAKVVSLAAYGLRTVQPAPEEIAAVRGVSSEDSCLIFMSPSAVRATVETFPDLEYLASLRIVSIGPVTSRAVRDAGLTVFAEAKEHTESGIVECLKAN